MGFFTTSVTGLKTVVTAIGAGVGVWGVINLLEGYGNDNPGAKSLPIAIRSQVTGYQAAYEWRWHHHCGTDGNPTAYHTVLIIHGRDH